MNYMSILYTCKEEPKNEMKETIPLIMASKRRKHLRMHLIKVCETETLRTKT